MKSHIFISLIIVIFSAGLYAEPFNDNFASRLTLAGGAGIVLENNTGATLENNEPVHAYSYGGNASNSVWFSWTAPETAYYTFDSTESDPTLFVCVYSGDSMASLTKIKYSAQYVTIAATNGLTYQIAIVGQNSSSTGMVRLTYYKSIVSPTPYVFFCHTNNLLFAQCSPNGSIVYCYMKYITKMIQQTNQFGKTVSTKYEFDFFPQSGLTIMDKNGNKIVDNITPSNTGTKYLPIEFDGKTLVILNQENNHVIVYKVKKGITVINEKAIDNVWNVRVVGSRIYVFQNRITDAPNPTRIGAECFDKKFKNEKWALPLGDYAIQSQNLKKEQLLTFLEKTSSMEINCYKKGKIIATHYLPLPLSGTIAYCTDGKGGLLYWSRQNCPVGIENTPLTYLNKNSDLVFSDKILDGVGSVWDCAVYADKYLFAAMPNGYSLKIYSYKIGKKMKNKGTAEIYNFRNMDFNGKNLIVYQEDSFGKRGITVFSSNLKHKWESPLDLGYVTYLGEDTFVRILETYVSDFTNYTYKVFNKKKTIAEHHIDYK